MTGASVSTLTFWMASSWTYTFMAQPLLVQKKQLLYRVSISELIDHTLEFGHPVLG